MTTPRRLFVWLLIIAAIVLTLGRGALGVACAGHWWPEDVPRYVRSVGYARLEYNHSLYDFAYNKLGRDAPDLDVWLYAQELAAINDLRAFFNVDHARTVRVSRYVVYRGSRRNYYTGGMRDWHVAVLAAMEYTVGPRTLMGVRLHEGGNDIANTAPWGVEKYRAHAMPEPLPRRWWHFTPTRWAQFDSERYSYDVPYLLRGQARESARIIQRACSRYGIDAWRPTQADLQRVGHHYKTGRYGGRALPWARDVWAVSRRCHR